MKKSILIILSVAMWGMAGQAAEMKNVADVKPEFENEEATTTEDVDPKTYNLYKAMDCIQMGDVKTAFDYLNQHLSDNPKSGEGYFLRGTLNKQEKSYANALSDMNLAIQYFDTKSELKKCTLYWWRASIYDEVDMFENAIADYTRAYNLANKSKENKLLVNDILAERAQLYYAMNMLDKADADYKQMIKNSELSLMARIGLARNMLSRGDYDGVIELLDNCEKINASYSEIYRFRMQAYYMKGETNKAINDAIMYIRIDDLGDFSAYDYILKMNLDYSYLAMKKLCAETNSINHRMLLTSICELRGDYAGAIAEYDKLENEIGPSASIYYFRSVAYSEIGEYEKAIEGMTKCLEMSEGKDFYVILLRADYYREMGKYEEAIADFSKAIELDPLDVYAYYKRGWCYELKGDDKTAMENYNTGITVGQDYPYIYLMRGTQYLKQGEIALANADFEVILAKDTVAVKGSCRHYALHFLGRNAEAIEWMDKIIELNPNDAGCYYDKACLYSRMGKLDEAVVALRIALEKGYRAFAHIENDNDMDAIRNRLDFIALIEEYKVK